VLACTYSFITNYEFVKLVGLPLYILWFERNKITPLSVSVPRRASENIKELREFL
jgi:hypothetical protein